MGNGQIGVEGTGMAGAATSAAVEAGGPQAPARVDDAAFHTFAEAAVRELGELSSRLREAAFDLPSLADEVGGVDAALASLAARANVSLPVLGFAEHAEFTILSNLPDEVEGPVVGPFTSATGVVEEVRDLLSWAAEQDGDCFALENLVSVCSLAILTAQDSAKTGEAEVLAYEPKAAPAVSGTTGPVTAN